MHERDLRHPLPDRAGPRVSTIFRENSRFIFWAVAWVGAQTWAAIAVTSANPDRNGAQVAVFVGLGGSAAFFVIYVYVSGRLKARRLVELRSRFPDACVYSMMRAELTRYGLGEVAQTVKRVKNSFVLVVHEGRVEFWCGFSPPMVYATIDAHNINRVELGIALILNGARVSTIHLCCVDGISEKGELCLPMSSLRESIWGSAWLASRAVVVEQAEELRHRIAQETGRELPPVTWPGG